VVSHWILDWIAHRPDLPLHPGGPRYGLGMWNSIAGTMVVEVLLFAAGIWLYVSATRARVGRYAFLGYIALLVLLYASDACSGAPPQHHSNCVGRNRRAADSDSLGMVVRSPPCGAIS
jgi:hypothetical protein